MFYQINNIYFILLEGKNTHISSPLLNLAGNETHPGRMKEIKWMVKILSMKMVKN
jgi:hypothetical protein